MEKKLLNQHFLVLLQYFLSLRVQIPSFRLFCRLHSLQKIICVKIVSGGQRMKQRVGKGFEYEQRTKMYNISASFIQPIGYFTPRAYFTRSLWK